MPSDSRTLIEWGVAVLYKHWPSLLGALVMLNWHPPGATWRTRMFSGFSAVALSAMFAAPLAELLNVDSPTIQGGIAGALSLFGLIVASQIAQALSGLHLILIAWVRRLAGLPPKEG